MNEIKRLKRQIKALERQMEICAYGKEELYELMILKNRLAELEDCS